jgi:hypothetical protein
MYTKYRAWQFKYTKNLDLHVQFCDTDLLKKRLENMGMKLYNTVPNPI